MLLNPHDYSYEYFHQQRGEDGDSGAIHIGTPNKDGLCTILVKDYNISDAINEFVGCNLGQRIGVYTPKAWLFNAKKSQKKTPINFAHAVGIEYLEGFVEQKGRSFDTEEMAVQTIRAELLHIILRDTDQHSCALCNGMIYAFDFADGVYWDNMGDQLLDFFKEWSVGDGFTKYQKIILDQEVRARQELREYFHCLIEQGVPRELVYSVYSEMRENIIHNMGNDGFSDLLQDIRDVFTDNVARFVREIVGAVANTLIDFPVPEGAYFRTRDGVLVMTDKKPKLI